MKNTNNSSFLSHHRNPKNNNLHHHNQCHNPTVHKCEFCQEVFTTGQALGGHKTCHRSNQQIRDDHHHGHKTIKITFSITSDQIKQNKHSWTRVFRSNMATKSTTVHPPTASTLKPTEQELPAVDLLSLLPPKSYTTKKRSRRYLIHHELANNAAPTPLLDMSCESVLNLDLNHRECNRMKLSSNGNDEMMHRQDVLPTSGIDETVVNMSEGEIKIESRHEFGSRAVRNFDLNDLPSPD